MRMGGGLGRMLPVPTPAQAAAAAVAQREEEEEGRPLQQSILRGEP